MLVASSDACDSSAIECDFIEKDDLSSLNRAEGILYPLDSAGEPAPELKSFERIFSAGPLYGSEFPSKSGAEKSGSQKAAKPQESFKRASYPIAQSISSRSLAHAGRTKRLHHSFAPDYESAKIHDEHMNEPNADAKRRISNENFEVRRATTMAPNVASKHDTTNRFVIAGSFHNAITGVEQLSSNVDFAHSHQEYTRANTNKTNLYSGEASQMLEKVAKYLNPAQSPQVKFTDVPPATLSYREFANDSMFQCSTTQQRYTQALIWCLSRRMSFLAKQGTTSQGMRLIQVLGDLRAKIREGVLAPFSSRGVSHVALPLKPTQTNPKNERNARDLEIFTKFHARLEENRRGAINLLCDAEKWVGSVTVSGASVMNVAAVEKLEIDQLTEMQTLLRACVFDLAAQSVRIEAVAEDARELLGELQDRYLGARCDSIFPTLEYDSQ